MKCVLLYPVYLPRLFFGKCEEAGVPVEYPHMYGENVKRPEPNWSLTSFCLKKKIIFYFLFLSYKSHFWSMLFRIFRFQLITCFFFCAWHRIISCTGYLHVNKAKAQKFVCGKKKKIYKKWDSGFVYAWQVATYADEVAVKRFCPSASQKWTRNMSASVRVFLLPLFTGSSSSSASLRLPHNHHHWHHHLKRVELQRKKIKLTLPAYF